MKLGYENKERSVVIPISMPEELYKQIAARGYEHNRSVSICELIRKGLACESQQ